MKTTPTLAFYLSGSLLFLSACSGTDPNDGDGDFTGGGGNATGTGAQASIGGTTGDSGGAPIGTGGASGGSGGTPGGSGGVPTETGGSGPADGGAAPNTGGTASGGASGGASPETGGSSSGGSQGGDDLPWLHVEGNEIKDPEGNTIILRGVSLIDIGSVEEWDGGLKNMIDRITNKADDAGTSPGWYPTVIRLAVYPEDNGHHEPPITYEEGSDVYYDTILRPIVDYIRDKGAYSIIDWHYIDDTTLHQATTKAFWEDIAPKFADDSNVIFELYNEPINQSGGWNEVRADMQDWYDTVRVGAPDNLVLVGTPNWCQNIGDSASTPVTGTNIAYVGHMYPMHWESQGLRDQITTALSAHPVFLTEWGYEEGKDAVVDGTLSSYGLPFQSFVNDNGASWIAWVAHNTWFPSMFDSSWDLLVGESYMGGHAKDWLYDKRNDHSPVAF